VDSEGVGMDKNDDFGFGFDDHKAEKSPGFRKSRKNENADEFDDFDNFVKPQINKKTAQTKNVDPFEDPFSEGVKETNKKADNFDPFGEDPFQEDANKNKNQNLNFGKIKIKQVESFTNQSQNDSSIGASSRKRQMGRGLNQKPKVINSQDPKLLAKIRNLEEELAKIKTETLPRAHAENEGLKRKSNKGS
jgi:hypothetical protein